MSTLPARAFPEPEYVDNSATNGWDVGGSAGSKTVSISAGPARVAMDPGGGPSNVGGSLNRVNSSKRVDSNTKSGLTSPKGALSPQAANDPPVAFFRLTEIVDKPLEWVVEGLIPRADLAKVYALCHLEDPVQLEGGSRPDGERNGETLHAGGAGEIAADADSVAGRPSLRPRMFQWHRDLPVLEAELKRLRAGGRGRGFHDGD